MKKIAALLLVVVLVCVLCVPAFATNNVISPEKSNVTANPQPTSPKTGLVLSIAGASAIALASGSIVVASLKKAGKED